MVAREKGKPKDHYTKTATSGQPVLRTSTPNNLPRLQPFFGREEELKTIREALDPENRTWGALIDGPGSMGKTSLAVRTAYDCPPGQFQRIIFLSVKDRELDDDGERKLTGLILPGLLEMLNEIARELGQPEITKASEEQRGRLRRGRGPTSRAIWLSWRWTAKTGRGPRLWPARPWCGRGSPPRPCPMPSARWMEIFTRFGSPDLEAARAILAECEA